MLVAFWIDRRPWLSTFPVWWTPFAWSTASLVTTTLANEWRHCSSRSRTRWSQLAKRTSTRVWRNCGNWTGAFTCCHHRFSCCSWHTSGVWLWWTGLKNKKKIVFRTQMLARIRESQGLNKEYQEAFQRTKERLRENPNERQFEFRYT